jgi:putative DNA primase/helicase
MSIPVITEVKQDVIPAELRSVRQWVCWTYSYRAKWTKPPINPLTRRHASVTNRGHWALFQTAYAVMQKAGFAGVGFVLTEEDPYIALDLDDCVTEVGGIIEPWAQEIVDRLRSYTEYSPSGHGLCIFVRGHLPPGGRKKEQLELYSCDRYVTVTGHHVDGTSLMIELHALELQELHSIYFPAHPDAGTNGDGHRPPISDQALIAKLFSAANREKFLKLWLGDTSSYPSPSEADTAFCAMVAFYTSDPAPIDALYRRSGLHREKWDERHGAETYGQMTIRKALELVHQHAVA